MKIIDKLQEKKIRVLFGLVAFLGGMTTLLLYAQKRKYNKESKEILDMERELKSLQLEELRLRKKQRAKKG